MVNGSSMPEAKALTNEESALQDRETALKVLGGFGQRVHFGDLNYAGKVNEVLDAVASVNAADVECSIMMTKVRVVGDTPEKDSFRLVGGTFGTEPELTALHMLLGAELRLMRCKIQKSINEADAAMKAKERGDAVQN